MTRYQFNNQNAPINDRRASPQEQRFEQPAMEFRSFLGESEQTEQNCSRPNPGQHSRFEFTATDWKAFIGQVDNSGQPITSLIDAMIPGTGNHKNTVNNL